MDLLLISLIFQNWKSSSYVIIIFIAEILAFIGEGHSSNIVMVIVGPVGHKS